jgi:PAS domain S-box-containing protein
MHNIESLAKNDQLFHLMADHILDGIAIIEGERVVYVNNRLCEITGYSRDELMRLDNVDLINPDVRKTIKRDFGRHDMSSMSEEKEFEIHRKDGMRVIIHNRHSHLLDESGRRILYHFEVITDITDRKSAEKKLIALNQELERRVDERTAELRKINQELQQGEQELEAQKKSLEDLNAALRVLLQKGEQDKKELEERTILNVKELVLPYLDRLLLQCSDYVQRETLKVIRSNLVDIISPFGRALSLGFSKLTHKEIQIANLIKEGRTSKEIAGLLHLSERTITTHRNNIRKKIGLNAQKANLRTHLLSLH